MNLTVNRLPAKTWNHLGLNETPVSLESGCQNHAPVAAVLPETVIWKPFAGVYPQGLVGDLDALTACATSSLIETKDGVQMEQPLVLHYLYTPGEKAVSRLVLHAGAGSHMKVVLLLKALERDCTGTTSVQAQIDVGEGATVDLYVAQMLGSESTGLFHVAGICQDQGTLNLTKLELGAGKLYAGANVDLLGRESAFNTDIGYHGRTGQLLDMNYVAAHYGKNSESLMNVSGTLEEDSKKIFRGTIDFQRGCGGSKGNETENVMLLGERMVNQTIPLILCQEEDVEGNHGASIGRLDDKVLFYLGSRGISEAAAQQLIAQARIQAVCAKIPVESVRKEVEEYEDLGGMAHGSEL